MRTSVALLATGALALGLAACSSGSDQVGPPDPTPAPEPSPPADPLALAGRSVVTIQVGQSGGTGVVVTTDGHVLTSGTVVGDAGDDPITVTFGADEVGEATLVGADSRTGLAVVKVDGVPDLTAAAFADGDPVGVGDQVIVLQPATGAPVSTGTILATGRVSGATGMVETDVAVGLGSAGGPLVNRAGEVVGIVMAISGGDGTERSLAIPSDLAGRVAEQLIAGGPVIHTYLGVAVDEAPGDGGVLVQDVADGSPAAQAGMQPGDVIVQLGDEPVESPGDVLYAVQARRPGDQLVVLYTRDGIERDLTVTLGEAPAE